MKKFFAIMVAVAALAAFTAPAWADEAPGPNVVIGGRFLTDLGYNKVSKELTNNQKEDVTTAFVNMAAHSYMNAKFTSADKTTGGFVEMGITSKANNQESMLLRYAYGWWKVGNCRLLAGHDDGWLGSLAFAPKQYFGLTQSGKLLLSNWGYTYSGRHPQVRFEWASGNFGFALAAAQPGAEKLPTIPANEDYYANVPRFDLTVRFMGGGLLVMPSFGISQLQMEGTPSGADDSFTTYIALLPVKYTIGPFTAKAEFHYAQNSEVEWNGVDGGLKTMIRNSPFIGTNGKLEDTKMVGGFVALEYKLTQDWEATAGFGIEKLNNDAWKKSVASGGAGYKDDEYYRKAYFVAFPYQITKNFAIHPEFGYYDYGDAPQTDKDAGNEWLLGLQFRFVF